MLAEFDSALFGPFCGACRRQATGPNRAAIRKVEAVGVIGDRAAPAIDLGEGPFPATIALITPKSAQFAGRMAEFDRIPSLRQLWDRKWLDLRTSLRSRVRSPGRSRRPRPCDRSALRLQRRRQAQRQLFAAGRRQGRGEADIRHGRELSLPQVLSADGGRYANAGIEFWIKGQSATLTMNGVKETCSTQ